MLISKTISEYAEHDTSTRTIFDWRAASAQQPHQAALHLSGFDAQPQSFSGCVGLSDFSSAGDLLAASRLRLRRKQQIPGICQLDNTFSNVEFAVMSPVLPDARPAPGSS